MLIAFPLQVLMRSSTAMGTSEVIGEPVMLASKIVGTSVGEVTTLELGAAVGVAVSVSKGGIVVTISKVGEAEPALGLDVGSSIVAALGEGVDSFEGASVEFGVCISATELDVDGVSID